MPSTNTRPNGGIFMRNWPSASVRAWASAVVFLARHAGRDIEDHQDIGDGLALVVDHLARDRRSTGRLGEDHRRQQWTEKRRHRTVLHARGSYVNRLDPIRIFCQRKSYARKPHERASLFKLGVTGFDRPASSSACVFFFSNSRIAGRSDDTEASTNSAKLVRVLCLNASPAFREEGQACREASQFQQACQFQHGSRARSRCPVRAWPVAPSVWRSGTWPNRRILTLVRVNGQHVRHSVEPNET